MSLDPLVLALEAPEFIKAMDASDRIALGAIAFTGASLIYSRRAAIANSRMAKSAERAVELAEVATGVQVQSYRNSRSAEWEAFRVGAIVVSDDPSDDTVEHYRRRVRRRERISDGALVFEFNLRNLGPYTAKNLLVKFDPSSDVRSPESMKAPLLERGNDAAFVLVAASDSSISVPHRWWLVLLVCLEDGNGKHQRRLTAQFDGPPTTRLSWSSKVTLWDVH